MNPFPFDQPVQDTSLHILSTALLLEIGPALDLSISGDQNLVLVAFLASLILKRTLFQWMGYMNDLL